MRLPHPRELAKLRREYEDAVRGLAALSEQLLRDHVDVETAARHVHAERRALTALFKARTPEPLRSRVRARTVAAYGDDIGPTVEYLRARGRTWEEILQGASRPGPPVS